MPQEEGGGRREGVGVLSSEEADGAALCEAGIHVGMAMQVVLQAVCDKISLRDKLYVRGCVCAYLI